MQKIKSILPGMSLCFVIAIACWLLGQYLPVVGGPVFAIVTGMIIAVFYKNKRRTKSGIALTSKYVLQLAVVLLGFGLNLTDIARVGKTSLPVIIATISTSLIMSFILYKALHIPANASILVGVGSSICGGSAIAATAPVIHANDEEVAQAISVIFFFNVIAAVIFPFLGGALHLTNQGFGLFAGTAVNDTSSVTAAASAWDGMHAGADTLDMATIVKLTRTLAIIPITLALALYQAWKAKKQSGAMSVASDKSGAVGNSFHLKKVFPMFILFFLLASVVTTAASSAGMSAHFFEPLKSLSKFFIIMAMAAIGLNTDIVKMIKTSGKALLQGMICWVAIAIASLLMQHVIGIW